MLSVDIGAGKVEKYPPRSTGKLLCNNPSQHPVSLLSTQSLKTGYRICSRQTNRDFQIQRGLDQKKKRKIQIFGNN